MSQIDVKFDIISTFPTSGTVFFPPKMTSHLFETHRKYYTDLAEFNTFENENGYNFPERWDPHCTLATHVNHEQVLKTIDYCFGGFSPMSAKIIEIGIVKLEFNKGMCVSSKTIFSNSLN